MDRQAAWDLLCEFTKTEPLRKHALAVEAALTGLTGHGSSSTMLVA
jgi:predicted hydrolase (HD superfamily)